MTNVLIWTPSDLVVVALLLLTVLLALVLFVVNFAIRLKCHHTEGVIETSSCDALCRSCGKNLGFVGNISPLGAPGDSD